MTNPLFDLIPEPRQKILLALKDGPKNVEELARHLRITISGARQHLKPLVDKCKVREETVNNGKSGRPPIIYHLDDEVSACLD